MPNNITISGPKNPPIGKVGAYYSINLPMPKDSNMTYRWFIYRPGSEKTLIPGSNKEGIKVNFSFDDQWKNKTYLIKVFECVKGKTYKELFEAGKLKKELASFEITPKEAVNTKILNPEILKVDHRKMGDGDPNKVSYQDTLLVWAETQGLQNKEITFKLLWNNDKEPKKVFKAKVDNKGRAEVKIPLSTHPDVLDAYVKNKTSKDKSTEHTFKVEASFGEPPKTNGKKATQVKGKIKDVYFIDKNNKKVTKLKKGDVVRVRIESEGMINKSFQYFILEKDKYTPDDSITSSGVLTFKDDIFIGREIEIDDEKLLWGGKEREGEDRKEQNYTIEVKTFSDSKGSKPFQITTEDLKVEYGISAVKVTTGEVNKNTKTLPANSLFLPDIQIKEVYEVKDDKNVSLEPDKEADKHIKVLDEKTSVATEYKEKDITTVKQTNSMIIRFSVTPKGGKKVGYLGVFLTTIPEAENLYGYELYYNYKNVLSPSIASITIKEGEKERPFGSGYTTKINGKETEFELKIVFNEDKKINSDVFIDIFSNTNAVLAKPTLSGTALHRFKMKMAKIQSIITYHIYYDGRIEKHIPKEIAEEFKQKYKYVYHDEKGNEHKIGAFKFLETTEMKKGNIAGTKKVELIDIREFKGYDNNGVKLKFLQIKSKTRFYINPDCYAGLLGAMAKLNIDYLGVTGFSDDKAGSYPSVSHFNGEKGDLRYLSTNRKGESTHLQHSHFDVEQQNKFNDALYLFGWGRLEKMYSEYFTYNGNSKYLLNHTKHMKKAGRGGYDHYHHLHLTGFDHTLIQIIKE